MNFLTACNLGKQINILYIKRYIIIIYRYMLLYIYIYIYIYEAKSHVLNRIISFKNLIIVLVHSVGLLLLVQNLRLLLHNTDL